MEISLNRRSPRLRTATRAAVPSRFRKPAGTLLRPVPLLWKLSGGFVANATQEERKLLESRGCPVRAMLDHIVETFERTQLTQFVRDKYRGGAEEEHPALAVA